MNHGLDAGLTGFVRDGLISTALNNWATGLGGTVQMLSHPRRMRGFTEAFSFTIRVNRPDNQGRRRSHKLMVKVLPSRPGPDEAARHAQARAAAPAAFADHLVEQHHGCYPVGDGRYLTFQDVANAGDPVRELGELTGAALVNSTRNLVTAILRGWNDSGRPARAGLLINPCTVGGFVRRELEVAASLPEVHAAIRRLGMTALDADWIEIDKKLLPNPLRLADETSPLGATMVDYAYGFSHGDLHGGNVLFACTADGVDPDRFWLVDLGSYEDRAPLTRDLVWVLLTTLLRWVAPQPDEDGRQREPLPRDQADALLHRLVTPDSRADDLVLPTLNELIEIIHKGGTEYATEGNWRPEWRAQYRLSLVSHALTCTTFDNISDVGRHWCLRLAAYAAQAFLPGLGPESAPPQPETVTSLPTAVPHQPPQTVHVGVPSWHGAWPTIAVTVSERAHVPASREATGPRRQGRHRAAATARPNESLPFGSRRPVADADGTRIPTTPAAGGNQSATGLQSPVANRSVRRPHLRRRANAGQFHLSVPFPKGLLRRIVIATLGGSLVSVGLPGATAEHGPQEWRVSPMPREEAQGTSRGAQRVTPPPDPGATARKLRQLADIAAGRSEPASDGRYAHTFLRIWSPDDLAPGSEALHRYREEKLWWTAERSGLRSVVNIDGGRSAEPVVTPYDAGELTDAPPTPPADPDRLPGYFATLRKGLPPELQNAAGSLQLVGWLHRFCPLSPGQLSALLTVLADTPGIVYQGRSADWAERSGFSISAEDGQGRRETLIFDDGTGRLLSHETTGQADAVLSYYLFLTATWTERTTSDQ